MVPVPDIFRAPPPTMIASPKRATAHDWAMTDAESLDRSPQSDPAVREVDCAIVGGGAAGLSAAINMGRMRRSVLVVDDGPLPWRHVIHNYLGFPEGIPAVEIRRLGWRQAARYGATLLIGQVAAARAKAIGSGCGSSGCPTSPAGAPRPRDAADGPDGFARTSEKVEAGPMEVLARSVILATGVRRPLPRVPRSRRVRWDQPLLVHPLRRLRVDRPRRGRRGPRRGGGRDRPRPARLHRPRDARRRPAGRVRRPGLATGRPGRERHRAHPCGVAEYQNRDGQMQALVLDDPARTRIPVEHVYTIRPTMATNELARQLGVALNADRPDHRRHRAAHQRAGRPGGGRRHEPARPPAQHRRPRGQPGRLRGQLPPLPPGAAGPRRGGLLTVRGLGDGGHGRAARPNAWKTISTGFRLYSRHQSISGAPRCPSASFARPNGRLPTKPRQDEYGDGCGDSITMWRFRSIRLRLA